MAKTFLFYLLFLTAYTVFETYGKPNYDRRGDSENEVGQSIRMMSIRGGVLDENGNIQNVQDHTFEVNNMNDVNDGLRHITSRLGPEGVDLSDVRPDNVNHEVMYVDGNPVIKTTVKVPQCCNGTTCIQLKDGEVCTERGVQPSSKNGVSRPQQKNQSVFDQHPLVQHFNNLFGTQGLGDDRAAKDNDDGDHNGMLNRPLIKRNGSFGSRSPNGAYSFGNDMNQPSLRTSPTSAVRRPMLNNDETVPSTNPNRFMRPLNPYASPMGQLGAPNSGKGFSDLFGQPNFFGGNTGQLSRPNAGRDLFDLFSRPTTFGDNMGQLSNPNLNMNKFAGRNSYDKNNSLQPKNKPTAAIGNDSNSYREKLSGLGHNYSPDATMTMDTSTPDTDAYTNGQIRLLEPNFSVPEYKASTPYNLEKKEADSIVHNVYDRTDHYRRRHKRDSLKLNQNLANLAQDWANHLASNDEWGHRENNNLGENIAKSQNSPNPGRFAVDGWYEEMIEFFPGDNEDGFRANKDTHHMTQLLWSKTKEIGCGTAKSQDNYIYVVCNYNPPGNVEGFYKENLKGIDNDDVSRAYDEKKERKEEIKIYLRTKAQKALEEQMQRINSGSGFNSLPGSKKNFASDLSSFRRPMSNRF